MDCETGENGDNSEYIMSLLEDTMAASGHLKFSHLLFLKSRHAEIYHYHTKTSTTTVGIFLTFLSSSISLLSALFLCFEFLLTILLILCVMLFLFGTGSGSSSDDSLSKFTHCFILLQVTWKLMLPPSRIKMSLTTLQFFNTLSLGQGPSFIFHHS